MKSHITTILPKKKEGPVRVVAYCRVSTSGQDISNQQEHYETLIKGHRNWVYAGIYTDPGFSGTHMASRPGMQSMLSDALAGKFDLILSKSISRFARNTVECLSAIRMLVSKDVHLYFEKENIYTGNMESELLLTLHSTFANEESRIISGNVKWSVKKRFEDGTYKYSKAPYGYVLENGTFKVNEDQAETICSIFDAVLSGSSTAAIAKSLNDKHIPTGTKKKDGTESFWTASRIQGIVRNPVYIGDVLMQKTYADDQFYRKINHGERDQYYMDHHHEAIIDKETFEKANDVLFQRSFEKGNKSRYEDPDTFNTPHIKSPFSEILFCAECGSKLKRITQSGPNGKRFYWSCTLHIKDKNKCYQKRVSEVSIENAFMTMLNKLKFAYDIFFPTYLDQLKKEVRIANPDATKFQVILDDNHKKRLDLIEKTESGKLDITSYQVENMELNYTDQIALKALEKIDRGSHLIAETILLRNTVSFWEYKEGTPFPREAFSLTCTSITVSVEKAIFQLRCGITLTESLSTI